MNTKLDIAKILTLSTAHIKPETATMLDNEPNTDDLGLSVYNKAGYGWLCLDTDGEEIEELKIYQ